MNEPLSIKLVAYTEIEQSVREHLNRLPSKIDSFLEDHILASNHYLITISGGKAGFASIHKERTITQFALADTFRAHGQAAFGLLRHTEQVTSSFVPTCDEYYLAQALEGHRLLATQAFFFQTPANVAHAEVAQGFQLRAAAGEDAKLIQRETGDFFDDVGRRIERKELYVTTSNGETAGFGIIASSALYANVASIGMFTIERYRRAGIGTATIRLLIEECFKQGIQPIAGCWYYNHRSKRTLERAGMYAGSRLLKIDY
jgi:GNAT superfamily N-acetyltransferase